jgi:RNA polymerase sigma factor (sigma-70 family)
VATRAAGRRGIDDDIVATTLATHGHALLATAQRHSLCPDDAADAYQRALEIFLRHATRLDPKGAHKWLHTVVKHEAVTLRAERQRVLPRGTYDFISAEARHEPSPDDHVLDGELAARAAEALTRLKPAEAQALFLKATGRSYEQIAADLGWTRTKVNRCLAEGRARLRAGMEGIDEGDECARWAPVLAAIADGSAASGDLTAARRHLRNCPGCRAEVRTLHDGREARLGAFFPIGVLLAGLHERAATSVLRAQALLDALAGGKAAAVAASAAAIAGGSLSVVDRALEPDRAHLAPVARAAVVAAVPRRRREGPVMPQPTTSGDGPTTASTAAPPPSHTAIRSTRTSEEVAHRTPEPPTVPEFGPGTTEAGAGVAAAGPTQATDQVLP